MTEAHTSEPVTIAVAADPPSNIDLLRAAARVAVDLNLPFLEKPTNPQQEMLLVVTPEQLELRIIKGEATMRGGNPVYAQLEKIDTKSGPGRSLSQPILKAIGLKKRGDGPTVIDASAGWGEDAWLLASMGCKVLAVERNKVVHVLLRDAVLRAGASDPAMLMRMIPIRTDARHLLRRIARIEDGQQEVRDAEDLPREMQEFLTPDVVYIDPMFPAEGRKTAERKPMKVLRRLVGDDADAAELLQLALRAANKRVVVKRPIKAEPLGLIKPHNTHKGKGVRYDVYIPERR